jgi:hypothetical protein
LFVFSSGRLGVPSLTNWPLGQNLLGGQFLISQKEAIMFDNLFVFLGPLGTSAVVVFALATLTTMFSVGRHFRRVDALR